MIFQSILFANGLPANENTAESAACFSDLNLDQVVTAIISGKETYDLEPFFRAPLGDLDEIRYRQEIFRDLEDEVLFETVSRFSTSMADVTHYLVQAAKLRHDGQKKSWFLDAVIAYCLMLETFLSALSEAELRSRGFSTFRAFLQNYVCSAAFEKLAQDARCLKGRFANIRYCLQIRDGKFSVRNYDAKPDYSIAIEKTFVRFHEVTSKDYRVKLPDYPEMNYIEQKILDFVTLLDPEPFRALGEFCDENVSFIDETIKVFDREVQFYLSYLSYVHAFREAGLKICYPAVSLQSKNVLSLDGYDFALAHKLIAEKTAVVTNCFELRDRERLFIVTGPNQGGKTTFARTFGQLHYLARLGCPVAGREARLFLCDAIFTHFEKAEDTKTLRGKLADDLARIYESLAKSSGRSIIIMNEIFTSTALSDALFLSRQIIGKLIECGNVGVFVTFIDELASLGPETVSMVSTVSPDNFDTRTFKIERRPAEGIAHAMSIAEKYRLTYTQIKERIVS